MFFLEHIWIIPLLPAFGAAMMFFFGRKLSGIEPPKRSGGSPGAHDHNHNDDGHGHGLDSNASAVVHDGPAAGHDAHAGAPELHTWVNVICVGVVVLAFLFSVGAVWQLVHSGLPHYEKVLYTWLGDDSGKMVFQTYSGKPAEFKAEAGFLLDPLSSIWLLFVTGVGMLIHIYSIGYMSHEGGYYRFFGYLNLFMFSMLTLIMANNYILMFVGWEGVGLCSYLLIGFYFLKHSASTAANKAFITNRVGDAGVILGTFTLMWVFGTAKFTDVTGLARAHAGQIIADPHLSMLIQAACLLLFLGACGKSAQLPLYVWLPDAMEGPTPVSALIHAATMVTAGVYMVARSNALFVLAPEAMKVVAIVGALTAIFAASIGLVQNDIKRVLAYSTVSQLGYMFLALGVGAFAAGCFHVFTHAFFKALLFLGSGSVIHAMSGEQDMRKMGGLAKKIPVTYKTMLIGTIAIAGFPPLAGFFSKDEILWQAWSSNGGSMRALWYVGYATAIMTAFYMFRLVWLTFFSQPRMDHETEHHIHESPKSMTVPLIILAVGSIFAGFLGVPHALGGSNRFEHFLEPVFDNPVIAGRAVAGAAIEPAASATPAEPGSAAGEASAAMAAGHGEGSKHEEGPSSSEYVLMVFSVGAACIGLWGARKAYAKAGPGYVEPINAVAPPLYRTLLNKYYVDELYDYLFTGRKSIGPVRLGVQGLGLALWKFDANVIDGGVNGAGWMTRLSGTISSWWDKWIIDGVCVNGPAIVARALSYPVRLIEWGLVQWYALVMVIGVFGFVWYYVVH
jgi:NADH-quinone oxidoreductase subunit L